MRVLLLTLAMIAWARPGLAANTDTIPFTVVPGSAIFLTDDGSGTSFPILLPYSALISGARR